MLKKFAAVWLIIVAVSVGTVWSLVNRETFFAFSFAVLLIALAVSVVYAINVIQYGSADPNDWPGD